MSALERLIDVVVAAGMVAVVATVGCREHHAVPLPADAGFQRRVIAPPQSPVHALPPHAIHDASVGPYRLDEPLATVLYELPSGPRIALLDIPDVVRLSVIRAEDDKMLIGGEPLGSTSFIAIIAPDVARTESGIAVGSHSDDALRRLGARSYPPEHISDPRLLTFGSLSNARFIVEKDRVSAIVLIEPPANAAAASSNSPPQPSTSCGVGSVAMETIRSTLSLGGAPDPVVTPACLSNNGEQVATIGEDLVVLSRDGGRRVASLHIPGLLFAGVTPADGHDELVAVSERMTPEQKQWIVATARLDNGHIVRSSEEPLYQLTNTSAGWIGARLAELDLVIDLDVRADALVASGVLLNRPQNLIHDAVPLAPAIIARKHHGVTSAGVVEGGAPTPDRGAGSAPVDAGMTEDAGSRRAGHGGDAREIPDARPGSNSPVKPAK